MSPLAAALTRDENPIRRATGRRGDGVDVLFVSTLYAPDEVGGAEISIRDFVNHAAKRGLRAGVFTAAPIKELEMIEVDGAPVMRAPVANLYHPMGQISNRPLPMRAAWHAINLAVGNPHFTTALKRFRPRIVCTNNLFSVGTQTWGLARAHGVHVVHYLHDYHLLCVKSTMRHGDSDCAALCTMCSQAARVHRARTPAVDLVLANSEATLAAHHAQGFFQNTPGAAVGVGIDVAQYVAASKGRAPGLRAIGYLGRLGPEKGVDILIRAFGAAPPDSSLTIAGAGDLAYTAHLHELAEAHGDGRIRFIGPAIAPDFLASVDVLVAPARWREPFGRTVIEGMSAGCVVVAPRTGGLAELIGGGDRGLSYDGGEQGLSAALANLRTLSSQAAADMRTAGASFARRFSRDSVADAFYDQLGPLMAQASP